MIYLVVLCLLLFLTRTYIVECMKVKQINTIFDKFCEYILSTVVNNVDNFTIKSFLPLTNLVVSCYPHTPDLISMID